LINYTVFLVLPILTNNKLHQNHIQSQNTTLMCNNQPDKPHCKCVALKRKESMTPTSYTHATHETTKLNCKREDDNDIETHKRHTN